MLQKNIFRPLSLAAVVTVIALIMNLATVALSSLLTTLKFRLLVAC